MIIGVPREIKDHEQRVALTPFGATALVQAGHRVLVEAGAGVGSGFADEEYRAAGAQVVGGPELAWSGDLVVKVKEPLPTEYGWLRPGLLLFAFLHLAAEPRLAATLLARGVTALAYETVQDASGALPILTPMSEVAGRMAPQVAAHLLMHIQGGRGKLLSGVPGVAPGRVVILGAGTVGASAAQVALGMGADVTLADLNLERLRHLDRTLHGRLTTIAASPAAIAHLVQTADVVIGAVLVPGARAPLLVTEEMVRSMLPGAVIVDVAIDQGGCVATIRPTTHGQPTYMMHGVVHYAVTNMPGAVPRTSTIALCNASLPYLLQLANDGGEAAIAASPALAAGLNTQRAAVTHPAVAAALGYECAPLVEAPPARCAA